MGTSVAEIRGLVTAAIAALDGWAVSRFAPEYFGRDADQLMHHAFAVGAPATEPRDPRQGLTEGMLCTTTVEVQWAHRLRGDAQSADYDAALNAEQDLVKAVVGVSSQHVLVVRLTRSAKLEGWVIGTSTFGVLHFYALS